MWLKLYQRKKGQRQFRLLERGEQVWLEATNLKLSHPSAKLVPRRYGLFPIINVISPVVYHIQLPPHWRIHNVFHVSLLTPYKKTDVHGHNFPEPPPDLIKGEPEYEVDQILAVRRHGCNQNLQYLLRWKGYLLRFLHTQNFKPLQTCHSVILNPRLHHMTIHLYHHVTLHMTPCLTITISHAAQPLATPGLVSSTATLSKHPFIPWEIPWGFPITVRTCWTI
jgi:hypothetical protein